MTEQCSAAAETCLRLTSYVGDLPLAIMKGTAADVEGEC